MKNIIFYDGTCGLCDRIVQFLLQADTKKIFVFAPLQGKTAEKKLRTLPEELRTADTLILITNCDTEQETVYIYGKAAFTILWLLGGLWAIPGLLSFLPGILYNWAYRLVAKNRKRFFSDACVLPTQKNTDQFLN